MGRDGLLELHTYSVAEPGLNKKSDLPPTMPALVALFSLSLAGVISTGVQEWGHEGRGRSREAPESSS